MKKLIVIVLIGLSNMGYSQDATLLIPYLNSMVMGLSTVTDVMTENEERLQEIKKVMSKVQDFNEFVQKAIAMREALNNLNCLADHLTELQMQNMLDNIGAPRANLFTGFMQCQYDIYYSTLEIDYKDIEKYLDDAFSQEKDLSLIDRINLIDKALVKIKRIRARTTRAKGALIKMMEEQVKIKQAEDYLRLIDRI